MFWGCYVLARSTVKSQPGNAKLPMHKDRHSSSHCLHKKTDLFAAATARLMGMHAKPHAQVSLNHQGKCKSPEELAHGPVSGG